ncbi:MAG: GNAT family N-acetyltransferase [Symbiobacteriaceae bacterium]|nr:GNAT family N-acetyltransferase [Symbiobacteriaceae bacterium]
MELVTPALEHKQAAWEYRQECLDCGESSIHGSSSFSEAVDYESWLAKINRNERVASPGWVTGSVYFAIVEGRIVGTVAVRHYLNDALLNDGGHIGYEIRPSQRRQGYGKQMLILALLKCREFGIERVLITCDKDNIASAKTAMSAGGKLENETTGEDGGIVQRYWIGL